MYSAIYKVFIVIPGAAGLASGALNEIDWNIILH